MIKLTLVQILDRYRYNVQCRVYSIDIDTIDSRYNHNDYNNILIGGYNNKLFI